MQGRLSSRSTFNPLGHAANTNNIGRIRVNDKQQILAAYGIGSRLNGWCDYRAEFAADFFTLTTFYPVGQPVKSITVFKYPHRDNDGYRYAVCNFRTKSVFQTNALCHALGNFKKPAPALGIINA